MADREIVVCGIPFGKEDEDKALDYVKAHGFTSVQIYMSWRFFEGKARGEFDWSFYDKQVQSIKRHGLKFVPFFLMGPRYVAPDWWLASPEHKSLYCLEHGMENPIESVWNPDFRTEVDRVMKAFAEHYLPMDVLESFQPGINGDYGEAIYPVHGNWPGAYHTHQGFWCGGEDAKESFRLWLKAKYGNITELNSLWRSCYCSFEEVAPFLPHKAPSRTAHLDMLDWYRGSMDEYADFWMECSKRHFPDTPIYLCTGGLEQPEHGALFSTQARIVAKYGCGIRLTNELNSFFDNLYFTVHGVSACKYYGAYMGLEPVGPMHKKGITSRTFGSAVYGNRQIFHYYYNLLDENKEYSGAGDEILKYAELLNRPSDTPPVTLFWPMAQAQLSGTVIPENIGYALSEIRKIYEVQVADEIMILDGFLETTKALIMIDVEFTRAEVLDKIADWVKRGGTLLSNRHTRSIELDRVESFDKLFGMNEKSCEIGGGASFELNPPEWAKGFKSIKNFGTGYSWMYLDDDIEKLAVFSKEGDNSDVYGIGCAECVAIFAKHTEKGYAIYYSAPAQLAAPKDSLTKANPAFRLLLEDFCRAFCGAEPYELKEGEQVRGTIGDKLYALTDDYDIVEVQ